MEKEKLKFKSLIDSLNQLRALNSKPSSTDDVAQDSILKEEYSPTTEEILSQYTENDLILKSLSNSPEKFKFNLITERDVSSNIGNKLFEAMTDDSIADVSPKINSILDNSIIKTRYALTSMFAPPVQYTLKRLPPQEDASHIANVKYFNPLWLALFKPLVSEEVTRYGDLIDFKYKVKICLDIVRFKIKETKKMISDLTDRLNKNLDDPKMLLLLKNTVENLLASQVINKRTILDIKNLDDAANTTSSDKLQSIQLISLDKQLLIVKLFGPAIYYIFNPTEEVQLAAITQNPLSIAYIGSPSLKAQVLALEHGPWYLIRNIYPKPADERKWMKSLKASEIAIKKDWRAISYIPQELQTLELREFAMKSSPLAITRMNDPAPSLEIQRIAVSSNGSLIKYIKNPSLQIQIIAVKQSSIAIKYIENPSKDIQFLDAHLKNTERNSEDLTAPNAKTDEQLNSNKYVSELKKYQIIIDLASSLDLTTQLMKLMRIYERMPVKFYNYKVNKLNWLLTGEDFKTNQYISKYISAYRKKFAGDLFMFKSNREIPEQYLPVRASHLFSFKGTNGYACPVYYIRFLDIRHYRIGKNGFLQKSEFYKQSSELKEKYATYVKDKRSGTSSSVLLKNKLEEIMPLLPDYEYDEGTIKSIISKILRLSSGKGAIVYVYNEPANTLYTYAKINIVDKKRPKSDRNLVKTISITDLNMFAKPLNWLESQLENSDRKLDVYIYLNFYNAIKSGKLPGSIGEFSFDMSMLQSIITANAKRKLKLKSKEDQKAKEQLQLKALEDKLSTIDADVLYDILKQWFTLIHWLGIEYIARDRDGNIIRDKYKKPIPKIFNFEDFFENAGKEMVDIVKSFKSLVKDNAKMIPLNKISLLAYAFSSALNGDSEATIKILQNLGFTKFKTEKPLEPKLSLTTEVNNKELERYKQLKKVYDNVKDLKNLSIDEYDEYMELRRKYKHITESSLPLHNRLASLLTHLNIQDMTQYVILSILHRNDEHVCVISLSAIRALLYERINNVILLNKSNGKKDKPKLLLDEDKIDNIEYDSEKHLVLLNNIEYSYAIVFKIYSDFLKQKIDMNDVNMKKLLKSFNKWFVDYILHVIDRHRKYFKHANIVRFFTLQYKRKLIQYNILFELQDNIANEIKDENARIYKAVYKNIKHINKKILTTKAVLYNIRKYMKLNPLKFRDLKI